MMTKREFCLYLIDRFCKEEGISSDELNEEHILTSSCLAVAMEHLGKINDPGLKEYADTRGGTVMGPFIDEENKVISILSARELLSLLPEEREIIGMEQL